MTEDAINNSYQILEDLNAREIRKSIYRSPVRKSPKPRGRSGKCRTFTEEEKLLYKLQNYKPRLLNF